MVACVLAILVESRYPSRQEFVALLILTLGVMLAVWQVRTSHALSREIASCHNHNACVCYLSCRALSAVSPMPFCAASSQRCATEP